jgi:hypothetical protein
VIKFESGWAGLQPAPGRPGKPLAALKITAAWHGATVTATRSVRYWDSHNLNVALLFLGKGDFGPRDRKTRLIYHDVVDTGVLLTKFSSDGTKKFTPVVANETTIELDYLTFLDPGSSGAPDYLTAANDVLLSITSVTSDCGFIRGGKRCVSTPLFGIRDDILRHMKELPPPPLNVDIISTQPGARVSDVVRKPPVDIAANQPGARVSDIVQKPNVDVVSNPDAGARGGFSGVWATVTAGGSHYTMTLAQQGAGVQGTYVSRSGGTTGTISGRITGGVLVYRWTEGGTAGGGNFTLAADGNSFKGWWSSDGNPDAQYDWNGTRR